MAFASSFSFFGFFSFAFAFAFFSFSLPFLFFSRSSGASFSSFTNSPQQILFRLGYLNRVDRGELIMPRITQKLHFDVVVAVAAVVVVVVHTLVVV